MNDLPAISIRLHSASDSRRCGELAAAAESSGFRSVWFAENLFERGVLPSATASALATRTLQICTGIINPFNRHPTLMAMEIGALDEISEGRALLGVGSGNPIPIGKFVEHRKPVTALRDTVAIVRALISGQEVTYEGDMFAARGVKLLFPLFRRHLPIYIAAMGGKALELCGEVADGLIIGNLCPPSFTRRAIGALERGARKAGRNPPANIVKYLPCIVDKDGQGARNALKPAIGSFLINYVEVYKSHPSPLAAISDDNGIDPDYFSRCFQRLLAGEPAVEVLDDSFVYAYGVAGTVEECAEQFARHRGDGVSELTLSFRIDNAIKEIAQIGSLLGAR